MARIRTIKPEFWADEKLAPLAPIDRLVFLGLVSMADDQGRLVDNVKAIDGLLFPETDDSARESLENLQRLSRVMRYVGANGQRVIQVTNWAAHQRVNHPARALLPEPPENGVTPQGVTASARKPRAPRKRTAREPQENRAPHSTDLRPTSITSNGATNANSWIAAAGDVWKARRGEPNYGQIGKALQSLVAAHGPRQVLATWEGYLYDRDGKSFATPQDFAANYAIYRVKWAEITNADGEFEPIPSEPLVSA